MLNNIGLPGLILILVILFLFYLPIPLAKKRGRNPFLWFMWGIILSPALALPLLLILGQKKTL